MILRIPNYYKLFHCIADKCKDSCCSAGWEIDIDEKTANFYKNVSGSFGDKLIKNISTTSPSHIILNKSGICPFLNDKKLCEIYINLGKNHMCDICKEHPRFYEWFDGVKEGGIGLCCEESARIILSQNEDFTYCDINILENSGESNYDKDVYNYLFSARDKIIAYLNNSSINLFDKLRNILWYGLVLQQDIDSNLLDDEDIIDVETTDKTDVTPIIEYITSLEINDSKWPEYLKDCAEKINAKAVDFDGFFKQNSCVQNYLKNIALYFIWRYFMKATFDFDVLSKVKLMYVSVVSIMYLFYCNWLSNKKLDLEDCIDIVKKYSEEIEYCEDNILKFEDDSYDMNVFDVEYLLGICETSLVI